MYICNVKQPLTHWVYVSLHWVNKKRLQVMIKIIKRWLSLPLPTLLQLLMSLE